MTEDVGVVEQFDLNSIVFDNKADTFKGQDMIVTITLMLDDDDELSVSVRATGMCKDDVLTALDCAIEVVEEMFDDDDDE